MGFVDNICTDKTGTITENQLIVDGVWNGKFVIKFKFVHSYKLHI